MFERVLASLRDPQTDLKTVARETDLKYSWLAQLRAGRFSDPGVTKIERLDRYFSKK